MPVPLLGLLATFRYDGFGLTSTSGYMLYLLHYLLFFYSVFAAPHVSAASMLDV